MIPLPNISLKTTLHIGTALAFALLLAHDLRIDHLRAKHLTAFNTEHKGRLADRAAYTSAQQEASAKALAQHLAEEKRHAKQAQAADTRVADYAGKYRAAVLRLASAQAAGRPSSGTIASASDSNTQGAVGPGGGSELLIPTADALICADNTARLQSAREWALSLNGEQR